MRPTTGPTAYVDDLVGAFVPTGRRPLIDSAYEHERVAREGDPEWRDDSRSGSRRSRSAGRAGSWGSSPATPTCWACARPSRLELAYLQTATDLAQMIAGGHFPFPGQRSATRTPRGSATASSGIDAAGRVTYASPNALSVYRRLGLAADLTGSTSPRPPAALVPPGRRPDEETLSAVLGGTAPRDTETGTDDTTLILRAIPLRPPASTSARWCCCATSPTCAGATASWSPRTPRSARSTTG